MASQAGHLVVYELRFGAAASQFQSSGAHAYFPGLVKTGIGLAAAFLVLALLAIGLSRVISGRRLAGAPAPDLLRLVAMLFCLQLACFIVQETLEVAGGAPSTTAPALLLWGTAGQLPVAFVAALALRWLAMRLGPAVEQLLAPASPSLHLTAASVSVAVSSVATMPIAAQHLTADFNRRGPPF